jgi:hypothetical protein
MTLMNTRRPPLTDGVSLALCIRERTPQTSRQTPDYHPLTPSLVNCKRRPLAVGYNFANLTPWATLAQPDSDQRSYPMIKLSVGIAAARCFLRVVALPDGGKVALGGTS